MQNYPERTNSLNIFFTNGYYGGNVAGYCDISTGDIHTYDHGQQGIWWMGAEHLTHELGHSFGLWHTYDKNSQNCLTSNFDFLYDVYDTTNLDCDDYCYEPSCPNNPSPPDCETCYFEGGESNNLMGGGANSHISPLQMGISHRRAAFNYELRSHITGYHSIPFQIVQDEIWDFSIKFHQDIIVKTGNTLTIECIVEMVPEAKIIVEPGAKLIIDGGKISNELYFNQPWQGIEVWGNPNTTQLPINQGWLVIMNEGTIENAEVAVRVGSEDYTGKGGGVLQANDGEFLNNGIGVWFDPYSYTGGNASYFFESNFDYTNTINGEGTFTHVKLDDVHYVDFTECTFSNNSNLTYAGYGIYSTNAIFDVEGTSTLSGWENSQFQNLEYGIYATAANTTDLADVRHTTFTENHHGIYLSGMTLPRITSNEFFLKKAASQEGYGLYLDACTDYWVEDNTFEKCSTCNHPTGIGIIVNESGGDPNEIYLNEFDYVEYAINVQGENRDATNPAQGLVIRCNEYTNTLKDETIIWDEPRITNMAGIADEQGSFSLNIEEMAGNIFHYETTTTDYDDLDNEANFFDYYYSTNAGSADVEPEDAQFGVTVDKIGMPTQYLWTRETACESNINTGSGGGTEGEKGAMNDAQEGIETTGAILTALVDGGDTETLNTEVETSTPPEAATVYNELMAESPNLSETVVESTIEKESVIPNAMLRDVMVANPHTAKSITLLEQLDERFDPMPEYMKAQILAGRSIQNLKQELESQLAGYKLKKAKAMNNIVRYYIEQLEPQAASDSILALYQEDNTLKSSYHLAWLYLEKGEYLLGNNIMDNIPTLFNLTDNKELEYNQISGVYNILSNLYQNSATIDSLTASQVGELQTVVNDGEKQPQAYARNILLAINEISYAEPVLFPNNLKSSEAIEEYENLIDTQAPRMLEVYPNPSKDYVILQYKLDAEQAGKIEVQDMTGTTKHVMQLTATRDQVTLITQDWNPGMYIATLKIDEKTIESVKFTVVK
jgi:hypothetical protein